MFNNKKAQVYVCEYEPLIVIKVVLKTTTISKMLCTLKDDVIVIGDISPYSNKKYYSKGYGSMMMNELIKFAIKKKYNKIKGELSIVDVDHKERLLHFYKKFGFQILIYDEEKNMNFGEIYKIIEHEKQE